MVRDAPADLADELCQLVRLGGFGDVELTRSPAMDEPDMGGPGIGSSSGFAHRFQAALSRLDGLEKRCAMRRIEVGEQLHSLGPRAPEKRAIPPSTDRLILSSVAEPGAVTFGLRLH